MCPCTHADVHERGCVCSVHFLSAAHPGMRKDRGSQVLRRDKRRGAAGDRDKGPRQLERRTSPPQDGRRNCGSGSRAGERTGADGGGAGRGCRIGIPPDQVGAQEDRRHADRRSDTSSTLGGPELCMCGTPFMWLEAGMGTRYWLLAANTNVASITTSTNESPSGRFSHF